MASHKADATQLLDERGYHGPLIRGINPAHLFEKAVRDRITNSMYWMEECYGLNAATLCDRAVKLTCIGGTYGGMGKPTPFLCLAFKLLQLVPEKEVILEYLNFADDDADDLRDEDEKEDDWKLDTKKGEFKYLRALAAFYIRLTWKPVEIYQTLEPLLADYRKLRRRIRENFVLTHMDQFIDDLLTKERVCATSLWKLPSRTTLEDLELLEPRESPLGDELEELDRDDEEMGENGTNGNYTSPEPDETDMGYEDRSSDEASEND
jgi:pre-mRNA-splicing factor 38A